MSGNIRDQGSCSDQGYVRAGETEGEEDDVEDRGAVGGLGRGEGGRMMGAAGSC